MPNVWVDFKALRQKLDFEDVLRHYGVEVKRKGNQHHGFCPLPNHNGKRNSQSFSANLERGIFQCFGCGAKGNQLDFAALMEKINPEDGSALREVAARLQTRFCIEREATFRGGREPSQPEKKSHPKGPPVVRAINPKLDFELQGLDPEHPYLRNRGIKPETIKRFGLGFCSRGLLKDRIAIPLHDVIGALIGYAGRLVDDSRANDSIPRYLFPGERIRGNAVFEFRKTCFLYNGSRIKAPVDDLIVVEGFASVWWLTQQGLPAVVATMGADCSERQAELIVSHVKSSGRVWVISDGDKAGLRHAHGILMLTSPFRSVRWIKLPEGKQPTDLSRKEIAIG